ncbi:winged helix-turn-helix domain-containing protein [Serratia oryzae]|uniref:OmpR/PhoB-type domain-containing protein n=1 Tax=Serratia oryzae TaxID=2034155 RepID=A0A1S8CL14_9GAMM|nr:helix-turn-helix domain-containing protein [Serratia oryzae]OMQ23681.1 hypothetical protein BMI79_09205 [Serratia oryzae]
MDYLIEQKMLYNSDDGTLHFLEDTTEDIVTLTPVLSRILQLLIDKQGQLITKDEFLVKVWDDYGRLGSSHTLNQYLSTLRKIFYKHLNEKAIITVSKQGYMLSPDIVITKIDVPLQTTHVSEDEQTPISVEKSIPIETEWPTTKKFKLNSLLKYSILYVAIMSLAVTVGLWLRADTYSLPKINVFPLGMIGECPVLTFSDNKNEAWKKEAIKIANYHASTYNLTCAANTTFYFYINENGINKQKGSYSILTKCVQAGASSDECLTTRVSR